MSQQSTKRLLRFALSVATVIAFGGAALASVRVGGSALSANGQLARNWEYVGPCPVQLKFDWGVISSEPTSVTYSFTRNDGGHSSSRQTRSLPGGNRSVPILETWDLGANVPQFSDYRGWVELNIWYPNRVTYKIPFTIHCG